MDVSSGEKKRRDETRRDETRRDETKKRKPRMIVIDDGSSETGREKEEEALDYGRVDA